MREEISKDIWRASPKIAMRYQIPTFGGVLLVIVEYPWEDQFAYARYEDQRTDCKVYD